MSEQIRDLHVAQREEDIGFYAGFLGKTCCHKVSLSNKNHAYILIYLLFWKIIIFLYISSFFFRCIIYDRQRSCISLLGYHS